MNEKISVIVPVYNDEKFLNKCVDSVAKQDYKNLEIMCNLCHDKKGKKE